MSVKISELPLLSTLSDNDILAGVDTSENVTSKVELATLKNYIDTNTQYTAGTNIDITENVISAPNVYNKSETDEQIEALQKELDAVSTIYNAFPTASDEDEYMTLDDTAETKFKKLDLKGNTSQTGTPTPSSPIPINVVSGDNTIDICGKNLFDKDNLTANYRIASDGAPFYQSGYSLTDYIPVRPNETYYRNVLITTNEALAFYDKNKTFISRKTTGNYFTTTEDTYYIKTDVATANINTTQLEVGSTATTYEPYIGKSYPIYLGVENLFNIDGRYETGTGISYTKNDDGSYTLNGTANGNNFLRGVCYLNEQHTISYTSNVSNSNVILRTRTGTPSAQTGIQDQIAVSSTSGILTSSKQFDFVEISIVSGTTLNNFKIYIQLEKGSKQNNFTPYGTTPIELCKIGNYQDYFGKSDGRNLCNVTFELGGIDTTTGQNGSGTDRVRTKDYVEVKPNTTYTLSGVQGSRVVCFYNSSKAYLSYAVVGSQATSGTFTTPNNTAYIRWYIIQTNTNIYEMLNEGSTALPYEPYGKVWYLHKEIGKVVLNGSENWGKSSSTANTMFYLSGTIPYKNGTTSSSTDLYCNNFEGKIVWANNVIGCELYVNNSIRFGLTTSSTITTVENWKTWLSTHNTIVYYVLANSTNTLIEDTTLIEQLEVLKLANSYESQTNISQENNDKPFILDVEAIKKLT